MISPYEIHLWFVCDEQIADAHLLDRYHEVMNEAEREQHKRFHFKKHRHQYLVTRALVRSVLSFYVDEISPQDWHFETNKYGKPSIHQPGVTLPLQFNLSHTDQMAVMAVVLNSDVGVDIEYLHRRGKTVELAESYFSPNEVEQLFDLPKERQRQRFFELWTLKEAYIKACGMGLSIPLNHFSYTFPQQGNIRISFAPERHDQPENWQFWHIAPSDCHRTSVVLKRDTTNTDYALSMRQVVPLADIQEMNYPVLMQSAAWSYGL
jgi:4'-phosphopantetheinyl transferase